LIGGGNVFADREGSLDRRNRRLEDWGQVLGDTAAARAILDRFLHHAEIIRLQGRSYRMHNRTELRSKQAEERLTEQIK